MDKLALSLIVWTVLWAIAKKIARYNYERRHHYDSRQPVYTKIGGEHINYRYPTLRKA